MNGNGSYYSRIDSIEAMKLVIEYLPKVLADPKNVDYHAKLALADTLGGKALANGGHIHPIPYQESCWRHYKHCPWCCPSRCSILPTSNIHSIIVGACFDVVAKLFDETKNAEDLESIITDFLESIDLYNVYRTWM